MPPIQDPDFLNQGFVRITRRDIPETPRSKASTGARRNGPGSPWPRDKWRWSAIKDSHRKSSGINSIMLDEIVPLPEDPEELRAFTARLLAEVKAQAILIEKLRHQLAVHRAQRFGASSETAEQLQLALETSEIAAAAMTARLRLPDVEEKDRPKHRPIPDHVPRMEVELRRRRRLRRLRRQAAPDRRGRDRGAGIRARPLHGEPDRAPAADLLRLRALRPGVAAVPPDRARPARPGPPRPCAGQQVHRPSAALSPEPNLRARRARPRPLHARRLGRKVHRAAGAAGQRHRPACARGRRDLRRRHPDPDAGPRHGQDPDRAALDLCP